MPEVEEELRRYAEAVEHSLMDVDPDIEVSSAYPRTRSTRSRRRARFAAALLVTTALVAAMALRVDRRDASVDVAAEDPPASAPTTESLFGIPTDTVLVFSDGIDGVTALDLDRGVAARRVIEGERAGDQPYRINLTGSHLVVGWGDIYAAPLDGGRSQRIDTATVFIPAAEPGEVWTVDYQGGRIGSGPADIRRVAIDGTVVFSSKALDTEEFFPLYGVPGGLVVRGPDGVRVWDGETGVVGDRLGAAEPTFVVSDGARLAWCDSPCSNTRVVELERTGPPTSPAGVASQQLAISPNGNHLAQLRPLVDGEMELVVLNLISGEEVRPTATPLPAGSVQWAADGHQLFYASNSDTDDESMLGRYDISTRTWRLVEIDAGENAAFIAIDRDRAEALLAGQREEPGQCPSAGGVYPSGRSEACSFPIDSTTIESGDGGSPTGEDSSRGPLQREEMPELRGSVLSTLGDGSPGSGVLYELQRELGTQTTIYRADANAPEGVVIDQSPKPGTPVADIDAWTLIISAGGPVTAFEDLPSAVAEFALSLPGFDRGEPLLVRGTDPTAVYKTDRWLLGLDCGSVDAAYRTFVDSRYDTACPGRVEVPPG